MKKRFKFLAFAAIAASLTGCEAITDMIDDTEAMIAEQEEVMSGKLFQIEQATVEYNNGLKFTFTDYGKNCAISDKSKTEEEIIVIKDKSTYFLNPEEKTYMKISNAEDLDIEINSYAMRFVYMAELYKYSVKAGKIETMVTAANFKSEKFTIAGKSCEGVSYTAGKETVKMAGYKRVMMLLEDNSDSEDNDSMRATSFTEKADAAMLTIPSDYKEVNVNDYYDGAE